MKVSDCAKALALLLIFFVGMGSIMMIPILCFEELDKEQEKRNKTEFSAWCKMTGNKSDLTYEEWLVCRPDRKDDDE